MSTAVGSESTAKFEQACLAFAASFTTAAETLVLGGYPPFADDVEGLRAVATGCLSLRSLKVRPCDIITPRQPQAW